MDLDDAAPPTTRRPSTTLDRPSRIPFGPRIRTKTKHSADTADTPTSPLSPSAPSPPNSPHDPDLSIDALAGAPSHADAAVQTPPSPTKPTTTPQKSAAATFVAPPPLTPPPTISFESTPIPWKGLPYEVAQWTFSSEELQEIVSKAIRLSARESFVHLLSLQALEVDVVHEAARLESERAAAQARWRFEVGRRTMLMQALNSTVASSVPGGNGNGNGSGEHDGGNLVASFIGQLASSIASCDTLLASILHLSDQQSQIELIQHQHWASALGVGLRKLNKSYERQGQELRRALARVQTLEDELEEAWREAEKMAIEFDELEHEVAESEQGSESLDERAEEDTEPDASIQRYEAGTRTALQVKQDVDETGTVGDVTINTDIAVVVGVTATAVASKATLVHSQSNSKLVDVSDAKSIRSVKSTRSRRSARDGPSHVSRLSAARTRSRTASNASLRLPKSLRSMTHTSPADAPPVPSSNQGRSFLDMGTIVRERIRKGLPPPRRPQPNVALPVPPYSAGLQPTRVPSIWLETDGGKSTRLNGLDRTHSLQIFSSLTGRTPKKTRRSNLVMSLTSSNRSDSATDSPIDVHIHGGAANGHDSGPGSFSGSVSSAGTGGGTGSPLSNSSPVSLPTHALSHFHMRGPSDSSSNVSIVGVGAARPGSAGARLTTTMGDPRVPPATPRRSLVSRASSVILRRLSQATLGSTRSTGAGSKQRLTPSRSREALRLNGSGRPLVDRWREMEEEDEREEEGEGEVMLIGSPIAESLEGP